MDENNRTVLCGIPMANPELSHECRHERFYSFPLAIRRSSGISDVINIIAPERLLAGTEVSEGEKLELSGEVRSYNNKSGVGSKLIITMYAKTINAVFGEDENTVLIRGTICKAPTYRKTPMGREICDLMIAVNRKYGRSDYLPCIAWGLRAREASEWSVGDTVSLRGRLQSRSYIKRTDDDIQEKTAYEISIIDIVHEQ